MHESKCLHLFEIPKNLSALYYFQNFLPTFFTSKCYNTVITDHSNFANGIFESFKVDPPPLRCVEYSHTIQKKKYSSSDSEKVRKKHRKIFQQLFHPAYANVAKLIHIWRDGNINTINCDTTFLRLNITICTNKGKQHFSAV